MRHLAVGCLAVAGTVLAPPPVRGEFVEAKSELKLVQVGSAWKCEAYWTIRPTVLASRAGDVLWWTLFNTNCSGTPKVKLDNGALKLFKKCRNAATGAEVGKNSQIEVTHSTTLVCTVDYVGILGEHPHTDKTDKKKATFGLGDVATRPAICMGPPPDLKSADELRDWRKICRGLELEIDVVP